MTQSYRAGQLIARREPSYEERFEIERAIEADEEFQKWSRQRRQMQLATIHLDSRRYLVDADPASGIMRIRQDILLDDYVENCIDDRAVLFHGLGA